MRSLLKASLLLVSCATAFADVAPDPGYSNVSADLTLETTQDLSEFRFFLMSADKFEEVFVSSSAPTVISASGRGGIRKVASLIAVPVSDLGEAQPHPYDPGLFHKRYLSLKESILTHYFQTTVSVVEKPIWKPPVYRLSIENGKVIATRVSGGTLLMYAIPVVIVGVLITIGIAIIGLWLFRRSRKKV